MEHKILTIITTIMALVYCPSIMAQEKYQSNSEKFLLRSEKSLNLTVNPWNSQSLLEFSGKTEANNNNNDGVDSNSEVFNERLYNMEESLNSLQIQINQIIESVNNNAENNDNEEDFFEDEPAVEKTIVLKIEDAAEQKEYPHSNPDAEYNGTISFGDEQYLLFNDYDDNDNTVLLLSKVGDLTHKPVIEEDGIAYDSITKIEKDAVYINGAKVLFDRDYSIMHHPEGI